MSVAALNRVYARKHRQARGGSILDRGITVGLDGCNCCRLRLHEVIIALRSLQQLNVAQRSEFAIKARDVEDWGETLSKGHQAGKEREVQA